MLEPEVITLLERVPELVPRFLRLVEMADDVPDPPRLFGELAELVADLARQVERWRPTLTRACAALEEVVASSPRAVELVGWGFFDGLAPEDLRLLHGWLGPRARALLDEMEIG